MKDKILVVAPHADDEVLGCGATIAKYKKHGHEVHILIITKGIKDLFSEDYMINVRDEAKKAHTVLGVDSTEFLDFPAPALDNVEAYKIANAIQLKVKNFNPDVVYIPHRGDIHKDHRMVFEACLVALRPVNGLKIKQILSYETLSETEWAAPFGDDAFIPNHFEIIDDYLNMKIRAFECFKSQIKEFPNSRSIQAIKSLGQIRGATIGTHSAEAFMLIRQIN